MLAIRILLLVFGLLGQGSLAAVYRSPSEDQSEIRIWIPKEKDNRFLNLGVNDRSHGMLIYGKDWLIDVWNTIPRTWNTEPETDKHLLAGIVYWEERLSFQEVTFVNSALTIDLATGVATPSETNATVSELPARIMPDCQCTFKWNGDGMPPKYNSSVGNKDNEQRLNWYVGEGTDVGKKRLWKGVEIACLGTEDLRSL
jgi:hypothetical protein